jgi:apolipoprotein N-acyltransferase
MADAPLWLALLLVAAVVGLMALYYALLGYLLARALPDAGAWRLLAGAPALWLLAEWLRGWLFTGFPWLSLGYAFTDTWLAGWATVLGVYGLSALSLLASGVIAQLVHGPRRAALIGAGVLLVFAVAAVWLRAQEWTTPQGEPVSVAVVQGATPQNIKWQPALDPQYLPASQCPGTGVAPDRVAGSRRAGTGRHDAEVPGEYLSRGEPAWLRRGDGGAAARHRQ